MTKRITSEDCEGNIKDIEDGRYNSHVVPVAAEDDPGYVEIDYADCTEFTVPLGRYGSHVVPIGGTGGGGNGEILDNSICPGGGLQHNVNVDGSHCIALNLKPGGAIIIDNDQLAIDTTKLKVTTDNVYPAGTNPGIVYTGPDGEVWDTQEDYNQWLYDTISNAEPYDDSALWEDQKRQDEELEEFKESLKCEPETYAVTPDFPLEGEIHFNSGDLINLHESTFGMFSVGDALVIEGERCTITYAGTHLQGNPPNQYWSIKAAVPDHIKQLSEVTIDTCDTTDYVTRNEFNLDQKRQDEANLALDAFIEAELLALNKKFDEDQKRQDDEFAADQERQDNEIESLKGLISGGGGVGEPSGNCDDPLEFVTKSGDVFNVFRSGNPDVIWVHDMSNAESIDLGPTYASLSGDRTQSDGPQVGEWLIAHEEGGSGYFRGKVVSISKTATSPINPDNTQYATHYELEGVEDTFEHAGQDQVPGWHTTAKVCAEDSINEDATYNFVTHPEFEEDQKRQDDALQEEILARAERDALHDAQINTIEYKLDALVGLQFKGIYEFKHEADCNTEYERCIENCMAIDPQDHECRQMCGYNQMDCERGKVRPGYFEAVDPDDQFDHLEYIVISKADKAGVEIDWAGVLDEGDYLEVDHTADGVLDKTNYGLYRITEEPEHSTNAYGEDVYTLRLQFLQGDGAFNVRENYEIRGITAAEGVSPEELGDFLTKTEAAATYALKTHGHAWGEITGKPSSYNPSAHSHTNYIQNDTTTAQTIQSNLTGQYFYGKSSGNSNGFMTRSDIEALVKSSGGGSDGSDHNHDGRYPKMNTGTSSNPSVSRGDFYLNTSTKVLYLGV